MRIPGGWRGGLAVLLALAASCGGEQGPTWVSLAGIEARGSSPVGPVEGGARVEARGDDLWLVAPLARADWSPLGEPGRFRAVLPVLAVGYPRSGGGSYRLVAGETEFDFEPDLERFGAEPGRFTTNAVENLSLLLALAPGEEPPLEAELWASLAYETRGAPGAGGDSGRNRIGGRRLSGEGLWVPSGHPRELALALPPDSRLVFATSLEPLFGARELRTAPSVFRVRLDGALVFEQRVEPDVLGEALAWHAIDLPHGGVRRARLTLEVEGPLALSTFLAPTVGPRELGRPGARPFAGAAAARPDLIVFLADTFRADNLAAYGSALALTPEIDRFASEARVFTHAWSTSTHTLPSHSAMFSGVFPPQNGQVDYYHPLPPDVVTLAERLSASGYRCGLISDGVMVSHAHGLDQGFEVFDERRESGTVERARAFLDADDGRPVFLFVQTYAVHTPYRMSAATQARWKDALRLDRSYDEVMATDLMRYAQALPVEAPPTDPEVRDIAARLHDLYRAGVTELDATFGRFRSELQARGLLTKGCLVFTSDHGEAFFEHGRPFHANRVFEEELRVPLLLQAPGVEPGREERPVSLIDFAPTLAGLAGLAPLPAWRGRSLLEPEAGRLIYAFQANRTMDQGSTLAVIDGKRKLIGYEDLESVRAGRVHGAFDLERDPGEVRDLAAEEAWPAELARAQRAMLEELLTPLVTGRALQLSPEALQEMRALGYDGADSQESPEVERREGD